MSTILAPIVALAANTPPTVSISSPVNNSSFTAPASIALQASATPKTTGATITKVAFYKGGSTLLGTAVSAPYVYNWTGVAAGSYSVTAKATDSLNQTTTSTAVAVTVNATPTVSISSPTSGTSYTAPASIAISATAAAKATGATISKVEFFNGSTLLGTDTTSPYSYTWANPPAGSYSLTAKATDSLGGATTSSAVSVTVKPPPAPTVSLTAPATGATFTAPGTIAMTATATANATGSTISKVEFFNGSTLLGTATTSPYAYTLSNAAAGSYSLTAKATDSLGAAMTSSTVAVTVKAPPAPTVSLTAPASGATFTAPGTIAMTATATAKATGATISKVEFFNGSTLLGTATTSPYAYTLSNAAAGSYSLTAKATDSLGAATTSSTVAVTVKAPAAPTVSLTAPTAGTTYTAPGTIAMKATATAKASGASISKVEFFNGSTLLGTDTTSPYAFTLSNAAAGSYSLTAKATDSLGSATTSAVVSVTVTAPSAATVSLIAPAAGSTYNSPGNIAMSANAAATASGASVTEVDYYANSMLLGSTGSASSPYAFTWVGAPAGTYALQALVTDSNGTTTLSGAVSVTVFPSPTVSITAPAQNAVYPTPANFTVSASVTPVAGTTISKVDFYNGNTLLGTSVSAPYSFDWVAVPAGDYYVTARATDSVGHVGTSMSTHIVVDGGDSCVNTPPLAAADSKGGYAALAKVKPTFEPNVGQMNADALFVTRNSGMQLALGSRGAQLQAVSRMANGSERIARLGFNLMHSDPAAKPVGEIAVAEKSNYLVGSDRSKWRLDIPHFERVRYAGVYAGIDQVFYGGAGQLEYDFVVHPSADPRRIRLAVDGAQKLALGSNGDLLMSTGAGTLTQKRPVAYQEIDGRRQSISARYRLVARNEVAIELGRYDPTRELVIDPVLVYSTFLGATNGASWAYALAVSRCGEAYVAGYTWGKDFPTVPGSYETAAFPAAGIMGYVAKLNQSGTGLLYSTYYGGSSGATEIRNLAIDDQGHAYISGYSQSTDLPVTPGALNTPPTAQAFVAKLAAGGGSLMYSTHFGGSPDYYGGDGINGLAIDADGNAYLTGQTTASDFSYTSGAMAGRPPGYRVGGFVSKLNPTGTALVYSTYLGGQGASINSSGDWGVGIAVDASGNAYVAGISNSPDFPTTAGSFMPTNLAYANNQPDGFAVKLNADGSALVYGTYIGSNTGNKPNGIAVDLAGRAHVIGSYEETVSIGSHYTRLSNQPANPNEYSAFVTRLNADGTDLDYFTGIGGDYCDPVTNYCSRASTQASGVAVDSSSGNVWVAGTTSSNVWPQVKPLPSSNYVLGDNPYVLKLNAAGNQILFSSFLKGRTVAPYGNQSVSMQGGSGVAIDSIGSAYVVGFTNTSDFTTTAGALQTTFGSAAGTTGFVVKINETKDTVTHLSASPSQPVVGLPTNLVAAIDGNSPTGSVTFKEGATVLGNAPVSGGEASLPSLTFAGGSHSVVASYGGDTHNNPSDSSPLTFNAGDPGTKPTVAVTSIPDGSVFTVDSSGSYTLPVALTSSAAPGNLLSTVSVYLGSPYYYWSSINQPTFNANWSWPTTLRPGSYTLYVTATDNYGNTTKSAVSRFSVVAAGATPATVTMTSPLAGASVQSPGAVTFTATATAAAGATIQSVSYYQADTLIGTSVTSPYTITWTNPPAGTYSVIAMARDTNNVLSYSAAATITVTTAPLPTIALTSPTSGTSLSDPATITVSANAAGVNGATISKVDFFQNGSLLQTVTTAPYTYTLSNVTAGIYFFTARATDSRGYAATSDPAGVAVGDVSGAPAVSIVNPTSYSAFNEPATVTVDAPAFALGGASVAKVEFYDGQQLLGTVASPPYRFLWNNLPAGGYSILAKATDSNGVTSATVPLNFVVNQTLPLTLTISAPLAVTSVNDDHVNVTGTVHAPPNSAVVVNGVLGAILGDGTFFVNSVPLVTGYNTLTATVTTVDGATLSQSVDYVNRTGTGPFRINASGTAGLSPTQVQLTWVNTSGVAFTHLDVSCADDGTVQFTTKDIASDPGINCTYGNSGNTRARVNVYAKSPGGAETLIYTDSWQVKVESGQARYSFVRGVLFQLLSRLKAADTAGAIRLFSPGPAQYYQAMFNSIGSSALASMVDHLGRINQTSLSDASAEFLLVRPSTSGGLDGFEAGLMLDSDGIWRVEGL